MLPEIEQLATVVVCEDDEPTRELLCDHLDRGSLRRAAGGERRGRAAALPATTSPT